MYIYEKTLRDLHIEQNHLSPHAYLHAHSRNSALLKRRIAIFERCQQYLDGAKTILDWGCQHAADSCLVRMRLGSDVEIHGCDVEKLDFQAFYRFANLKYSELRHTWNLPYNDNKFDVVIGGGVIEHVANDSESLKELYRVMRPGGHLIITMLPNKLSYTEWINRRLKHPGHLRLYSKREFRHMLMHHGFRPLDIGYHQMIPALSHPNGGIFDSAWANRLVEKFFGLNHFLERTPVVNKVSTNIFAVARKEIAFHG